MLTLRMTCTLTLTVVTVACAFPACLAKNSGFAQGDDDGGAVGSSGSPSSSNGASSSSGTSSSSGKPGSSGSSSGRSSSGGSGTTSSSGSSSSGGQGSSGTSSSSSGATTCEPDGGQVPTNVMFDSSGNPTCVGTKGCNLHSNVCCVDTGGVIPIYSCVASSQQCSNASQSARFGCVQKSDCPGDEVCCVQADMTAMTAGSVCMDVSDAGGKCSPATTSTHGSAQLCQTDAECKSGCCIWQDCTVMGNALQFTMCGLQNSSVFTCTAH